MFIGHCMLCAGDYAQTQNIAQGWADNVFSEKDMPGS